MKTIIEILMSGCLEREGRGQLLPILQDWSIYQRLRSVHRGVGSKLILGRRMSTRTKRGSAREVPENVLHSAAFKRQLWRAQSDEVKKKQDEEPSVKMTQIPALVIPWLKSAFRIIKRRILSGRSRGYTSSVLLALVFFLCLLYHLVFNVGMWFGNPSVVKWCKYKEVPNYILHKEPDEITLVTAYFNLGTLKTGNRFWDYTAPYKYKQWMRPFGMIANRMVVFVEDDDMVDYFKEIRSCFPENYTKIIKIQRSKLWSFSIIDKVSRIYSNASYPKFYPNTVSSEYTCIMHSKYELLGSVIDADIFQSSALAWVDAGYFKNLDSTNMEPFKLLVPSKLDTKRLAFSQVWPRDPYLSPRTVMTRNAMWVSTGFVLGIPKTLKNFTEQYRSSVEEFLEMGLMNTDMQVIYAMYASTQKLKTFVKIIKPYTCHQGQLGLYGSDTQYFCLGFVCKHVWDGITPS